ncbi:MAG: hypothetical protein AAGE01_17285 [Pseudomonadota bacterium]
MLWGVCAYFNPCGWRTRLRNYQQFQNALGIPLITVELAYGHGFELARGDADELIQLRGRDVMWQKERLLNIALEALPASCTAVAWLDADVIFDNDQWWRDTLDALDRFSFVQPFARCTNLTADGRPPAPGKRLTFEAMSSRYAQGTLPADYFDGPGASRRFQIAPGKAWAGRREILDRHGFYDRAIIGSADRFMLQAMAGRMEEIIGYYELNERRADHYRRWAAAFHAETAGSIGHVPGHIQHLWHGDIADRAYTSRHAAFARIDFDPVNDIAINAEGCFEWASDKPDLHAFVWDYLQSRREDGLPQAPQAIAS